MKAALVFGLILVALGVFALAYFASPVRILMSAYASNSVNPAIPLAGGLSLVCGLAILFASRPKKS